MTAAALESKTVTRGDESVICKVAGIVCISKCHSGNACEN